MSITEQSPDAGIVADPNWLAHRYDPDHDAVHFIRADRSARAEVPFLVDAELKPGAPMILRRQDITPSIDRARPVHFIFHSAYCCSTLLARAFDLPGVASALKEPQILNDLVGWRHRGGAPRMIAPVLTDAIDLLARPFERSEATIIKPSNVVNGLIEPILGLYQDARAVLLHAPLRAFVTSIARKEMWGRLWVRELLSKQLLDGLVDLGFEQRDYLLLTDLQVAAVGWLAQQALFGRLTAAAPTRIRMIDSERLIAVPHLVIARIATLFDLTLNEAAVADIVTREFGREAKAGGTFVPGARETARAKGEAMHRDEIDKVIDWAEAVAKNAGVPIAPPSSYYL